MTSKKYDVIIVGAGPVGLFLACELGLTGASVLVLERDSEPTSPWKVEPMGLRGINTPSLESFHRRGMLSKIVGSGERPFTVEKTPGFRFGAHFAGILLNANKLDMTRWKYRLPGPALVPSPTSIECIETTLLERATALGVTILRGIDVTKDIVQDETSVTVGIGDNQTFQGKWLVGCDGGRSIVRKALGFDFVGTEAKFTGYSLKCDLDHPEKLKPGFNITNAGLYIAGAANSLHLLDFDGAAYDRTQEITQEHIQNVLCRVTGMTDIKIKTIHLASSYTDRSKQATTYRKGRVLLAGDAAHIHSPLGAQGLNVGLGDAMNLGWKLAATVRHETKGNAPDLTLLDTYEDERHPVAAWVLEWTRAQVSTLQPDLFGSAVRTLVRDLIDTDDGANLFIDRVWGLSQRYELGIGDHPLLGCSAPDFEFLDGSRLGQKLEGGRGLLVDFAADSTTRLLLTDGKYSDRVDHIDMDAKDKCGLGALLIRPDGVVVWVVDQNSQPDLAAATHALERWFSY